MIPAPGREPTEKKLINLPDKLVEEIDRWAIGMFSSRAEFLDEAIRTFTRDRLFNDRKTIVKLQKEYTGEALGVEALRKSWESIWKLTEKTWKYESTTYTPMTIYITKYQMKVISNCFIFPEGPLKNIQDYARLAAAVHVDTIIEEREYAKLIDENRARRTNKTRA